MPKTLSSPRNLDPKDCQHAWEPADVSPAAPRRVEVPFNFCPYCGKRNIKDTQPKTYDCGGIPARSCED